MTQDLTVGKPISRIWQFAVPVLFGLLLQQVYSLVDTAIVGHALGGHQGLSHGIFCGAVFLNLVH